MKPRGKRESVESGVSVPEGRVRPRGLRGIGRSARGQGLVELVMVFPIFMMLFFGIFEFGRYYSTRMLVRSAVTEGIRFAVTGNELSDPITGDPIGRVSSVRETILRRVGPLGVTAGDIALVPADGGGPEEIVTVILDYQHRVATPLMRQIFETGALDFTISNSMRNEPFFD